MNNKTTINWDKGTFKEEEPFFIEFNHYLKELGLNVLFTQFSNSNYFSIYVHSIEDVENAKKIINKIRTQIIDKFFSIANKYEQVLKYDRTQWKDYSISYIYSFEIKCIEKVVRNNKETFKQELNRQLNLKPKFIFCHSAEEENYSFLPGYSVVFDNPIDLAKIDEKIKKQIVHICDNLLFEDDKSGFYSKNKIEIKYYDAITNSNSLYGMSRED